MCEAQASDCRGRVVALLIVGLSSPEGVPSFSLEFVVGREDGTGYSGRGCLFADFERYVCIGLGALCVHVGVSVEVKLRVTNPMSFKSRTASNYLQRSGPNQEVVVRHAVRLVFPPYSALLRRAHLSIARFSAPVLACINVLRQPRLVSHCFHFIPRSTPHTDLAFCRHLRFSLMTHP